MSAITLVGFKTLHEYAKNRIAAEKSTFSFGKSKEI